MGKGGGLSYHPHPSLCQQYPQLHALEGDPKELRKLQPGAGGGGGGRVEEGRVKVPSART